MWGSVLTRPSNSITRGSSTEERVCVCILAQTGLRLTFVPFVSVLLSDPFSRCSPVSLPTSNQMATPRCPAGWCVTLTSDLEVEVSVHKMTCVTCPPASLSQLLKNGWHRCQKEETHFQKCSLLTPRVCEWVCVCAKITFHLGASCPLYWHLFPVSLTHVLSSPFYPPSYSYWGDGFSYALSKRCVQKVDVWLLFFRFNITVSYEFNSIILLFTVCWQVCKHVCTLKMCVPEVTVHVYNLYFQVFLLPLCACLCMCANLKRSVL